MPSSSSLRRVIGLIASAAALIVAAPAQATGTLDQQQPNIDGQIQITQSVWLGQTFTAGITGALDQVDLALEQLAGPGSSLPVTVQIRTVSGGLPSSTILSSTSTTVSNDVFHAFVSIPLATRVAVTSGTPYAIVVGTSVGSGLLPVGGGAGDPYPAGGPGSSTDSGATWSVLAGLDLSFRTYVSTAPAAAADCKNNGWRLYQSFKNQGDCVKSAAS